MIARLAKLKGDRYYEMTLRPGNRDAYVKIFREMVERSKTDSPGIDKITMPTLIMWGKQDPWVPLSVAIDRWAAAAIQGEVDRVRHAPEGTRNHTLNRAAFALGLILFIATLLLNIVALYVVRKYREQYE